MITLASYASHSKVVVEEGLDDQLGDGPAPRTGEMTLEAWRSRGPDWCQTLGRDHFTPRFEIECARIVFLLGSIASFSEVCWAVGQLICPERDLSSFNCPSDETLRLALIKLDFVYMLHCRRLFANMSSVRIARFISPDSSPHARYDYFCCVEELMIRPATAGFEGSTFKGDQWVRKSMVPGTIGRGEGSVAVKLERAAHSATLEAGEEHLFDWRSQVKGICSDQGTGRGLRDAPFGDKGEVRAALDALRSGALSNYNPRARTVMLLFNALPQVGLMHVCFNGLHAAFSEAKLFNDFLPALQALTKILGDKSYSSRLLEKCFRGAERAVRARAQRFAGSVLGWRWEHLEHVDLQIIDLYEPMRQFFDPKESSQRSSIGVYVLGWPLWLGGCECLPPPPPPGLSNPGPPDTICVAPGSSHTLPDLVQNTGCQVRAWAFPVCHGFRWCFSKGVFRGRHLGQTGYASAAV